MKLLATAILVMATATGCSTVKSAASALTGGKPHQVTVVNNINVPQVPAPQVAPQEVSPPQVAPQQVAPQEVSPPQVAPQQVAREVVVQQDAPQVVRVESQRAGIVQDGTHKRRAQLKALGAGALAGAALGTAVGYAMGGKAGAQKGAALGAGAGAVGGYVANNEAK